MKPFEQTWTNLITCLKPGIEINNWTAFHGYLGDSMTIVNVHSNSVVVKAPKAINLQNISKDDFETVWRVWTDYKDNKLPRIELREMTRFSKYIISIFYWQEQENAKYSISSSL